MLNYYNRLLFIRFCYIGYLYSLKNKSVDCLFAFVAFLHTIPKNYGTWFFKDEINFNRESKICHTSGTAIELHSWNANV